MYSPYRVYHRMMMLQLMVTGKEAVSGRRQFLFQPEEDKRGRAFITMTFYHIGCEKKMGRRLCKDVCVVRKSDRSLLVRMCPCSEVGNGDSHFQSAHFPIVGNTTTSHATNLKRDLPILLILIWRYRVPVISLIFSRYFYQILHVHII